MDRPPEAAAQRMKAHPQLGNHECMETSFCSVANATARIREVLYDSHMLKIVLSNRTQRTTVMTISTDNSFPYVLVCSTLGTIVSLASVWFTTALSFAPMVGA